MAKYNPYFLQLVDTPGFKNNMDLVLAVLGYASLIAARVVKPPGVCRDQPTFMEAVYEALESGVWSRRSVEYAVLFFLLAWGGRYGFSLDGVSCADAHNRLSAKMRIYPQVCNDLRRGFVLSVDDDPLACDEWSEKKAARPTSLALAVAESISRTGVGDFRVVGAAVLLLGVLARVTPAYHLLSVALGHAADYARRSGLGVCSDAVLNLLSRVLQGADWIENVARQVQTRRSDPRVRSAELLTAEVRLLCRASRVLREVLGTERAVEVLTRASKLFGMSSEFLDPRLYLEDIRVLGVDPKFAREEVEVCLSRCG